jgi:hypothetical protein
VCARVCACVCMRARVCVRACVLLICIMYSEVFLNLTEVFLTLTEVFPCFFLSCKANAWVKLAKTGHGPHSSILVVICLFCCYLYCLCVNVYCHRVTTQLQLINISIYHIRREYIYIARGLCYDSGRIDKKQPIRGSLETVTQRDHTEVHDIHWGGEGDNIKTNL